jgi:hemerythrin
MRKTSEIIWQDAQHQVLFEILDLIREPGADGQQALYQLKDYTENHFTLEERYMAELDFPGREEHVQAHRRFRAEIEGLVAEGEEPDEMFRQIIATFLTEWLTRHVFGIDKKLESFLLQSNAR